MKLLDDYFSLQKQIYEHFGYVEDWVVIPLDDNTESYWSIMDNESVRFADSEELLTDEDSEEYYENEIYTQRFLPKWIYRTDDYTMVCMDTRTDGNKFLGVFDNAKERPQ